MLAPVIYKTFVLLATSASAVVALPMEARDVAVTKVDTTVQIACGTSTLNQDASWFLPAGNANGLVWLQHGFSRSATHVADLASKYAAKGYVVFAPSIPSINTRGCTLQNNGDNTPFLNNIADLFGQSSNATEKLGQSFTRATNSAKRSELTLPSRLFISGHSAGGEAVLYVANRIRTTYPATWANLRGVVLLDPVTGRSGDNTRASLAELDKTTLRIHTISAATGLCNSQGSGTTALQATLRRTFVGVRIPGGAHTDAEGKSTDFLGTIGCGSPKDTNVAILQTLATAWAVDAFSGTTTASYYPGGEYYKSQLDAGKIVTLAGAS